MHNKLTALVNDDEAVSPVIGVILMVAVTVVLAAVIGAFVFGIGDSLNQPTPNTQVEFDYNADNDDVKIVHDGGDTLKADNTGLLTVSVDPALGTAIDGTGFNGNLDATAGNADQAALVSGSPISAGDVIFNSDNDAADGQFASGQGVDLIWESPDGANSQVLASFEAP